MSEAGTALPPSGDALGRRNSAGGGSGRADGSDGSETRVEWGYRFIGAHPEAVFGNRATKDIAARRADWIARDTGRPTEVVSRTVTTSAWQPVTNDESRA